MKIWCLRCGKILAQTDESEVKSIICPCCSERISYSVRNREAHITCLNCDLSTNNELRVVATA